jgi:two-component system, sensor histidine kinase YesM
MKEVGTAFLSILRYLKSHIKYQLFFTYMAVIMSAMLLIIGVVYYFVPRIIENKYYQYMDQLNKQIILNISNDLSELERTSMMLNFEEDLKMVLNVDPQTGEVNYDSSSYKYIDNYFFNFIYSFEQIHGAYIYTLKGKNIFTRNANQALHVTSLVNEEQWFQDTLQKKGAKLVMGRHKNKYVNDNTDVISINRVIVDYSPSKLIGVIVIEQDVKKIGEIINGIKMGDKSAVIVLDDKDSLVYSNNIQIFNLLYNNGSDSSKAILKNGSNIVGKGKNRIYANQNLMESTGWKVVTCQPYSELMRDVDVIKGILQITFVVCLLLTFVASVFISGKLSSKLVKMKKMVDGVKKGNLDIQIQVAGNDEIAGLAEDFNSMVARLKYLIDKEYNETLLRKEAELNLLQAQINPHFLYNTLGSIKSLANDEGAHKAAEMMQSLSNIFRYNLGRGDSTVTIGEELENIRNYLALQQYRFDDRIKVIYEVDPEILNEKICAMTLQPMVENAIIHGFEPKQGEVSLVIRGRSYENLIRIHIIDNGVGISDEQEKYINAGLNSNSQFVAGSEARRIGIYNVNSRLKYRFGSEYGVNIQRNALCGVTIEIILPKTLKRDEGNGGEN